jgi:hypothetical protein
MAANEHRPSEVSANVTGPEIQVAFARLVDAHDHVRQVLREAGLLSQESDGSRDSPRLTRGDVAESGAVAKPHWDPEIRVLRVGREIVKQYRVPSPAQEAILAAFQEEGWPPHLDDPLPPLPDGSPADRLRSTIRNLNSNQKKRLIRFRGDGTGQGILWELID